MLNPFSSDFRADLYPTYQRIQQYSDFHLAQDNAGEQFWLVTGFNAARLVLTHSDLSHNVLRLLDNSTARRLFEEMSNALKISHNQLLLTDPPMHTQMRAIVNPYFYGKQVRDKVRAYAQEISLNLIDGLVANKVKQFDVMNQIIRPITLEVIVRMFGLPREHQDLISIFASTMDKRMPRDDNLNEFETEVEGFASYLTSMRSSVYFHHQNGIMGALTRALDNNLLTEIQFVSLVASLLTGGLTPTAKMLRNIVYLLLTRRETLDHLVQVPNQTAAFIEEAIRYYSSVQLSSNHWALRDIHIRNTLIKRGERIIVSYASANRDSKVFTHPQDFDLSRSTSHIGFGYGTHHCIGLEYARCILDESIKHLLPILKECDFVDTSLSFDENRLWEKDELRLSLK